MYLILIRAPKAQFLLCQKNKSLNFKIEAIPFLFKTNKILILTIFLLIINVVDNKNGILTNNSDEF